MIGRRCYPWIVVPFWLTAGCPKPATDDSASPIDTAPPQPTEHCGRISADEVWAAADSPHYVTCDVEIREATVQIEAGATVYMANGAGIEVGDTDAPGALEADGTADAPVLITPLAGDVPGAWSGITVYREGDMALHHTTVHGAGRGTDTRYAANVHTIGAEILLDEVVLSGSAAQGLVMTEGGSLDPDSAGLRVSGCGLWPVRTSADQAHTLPAEGSDYSGNRRDGVAVDGGDVSAAVTWEDLGVPYDVLKSIAFDGLAEAPAVFTIGPGTTLRFEQGAGFQLSRSQGESGLVVGETGGETVLFTTLGAEEPGWWTGISAYDGVQTLDLRNARLEYAEGEEGAALYVDAAISARLEGVEIIDSGQIGAIFRDGASFDPASAGITIAASGSFPLGVDADQVHTIPDESFTNNERDAVLIYGTAIPYAVSWINHGIPYVVDGLIELEGVAAAPAVLTIAAGNTLSFYPGAGISIAAGSNAAGLIAEGEANAPIVFTAESAELGGRWAGIAAYNGTTAGSFRFSHAVIEWAGGGETEAAIYALDAEVGLDDVLISDSLTDGLALYGESTVSAGSGGLVVRGCERPVTVSPRWVETLPVDSQLTGNTYDYIFINNDNSVNVSTTWPLHSVDYWVERVVPVGGGPQSVILTISPGVTLRFDNDAGLLIAEDLPPYPDGAIHAQGTASQPITFTAARAYDRGAWAGISIGQACGQTNLFDHVRIEYGGGDYQANLRVLSCDAVLNDVDFAHSAGAGLQISGEGAELSLTNVSISDSVGRGLDATDATLSFEGLTIEDSLDDGAYLGPDLLVEGSDLTIRRSGDDGIELNDTLFSLANASVRDSGGHGLNFRYNTRGVPGTLSDSTVSYNTGDGAHFAFNGEGVTLSSTAFENNAGWGVWWDITNRTPPVMLSLSFFNNALGDTP